jgi:hypothetical protein
MPVEAGSVTFSTAAAAMTASAAFPPCRRMFTPEALANGLLVATIPRCPTTIDRRDPNANDICFIKARS